ncbi:MAG TPA: diaminopimelate epimerase [Gemmatimonadales bacterium]|nr:diaminopimelate epimerase [Gemmatimonadales bacterium]
MPQGVPFFKMTGSGNDFIVLDGRVTEPGEWPPERIRALCDRRMGAGADGLVILSPEGSDAVRMHFFNLDGGRAAMCGNAALCSTALSVHLGLAASEMRLVADAGAFRTRARPGEWVAELNLPSFALPARVEGLATEPGEEEIALALVGVPHLVIVVPNVDGVELERRGRELRFHPAVGPAGANANFISPPARGDDAWRIRTYERGVEGETLACGTGTVAAAVHVAQRGLGDLPLRFRSRGGLLLEVNAALGSEAAEDVWLRGEGRLVYRGEWMGQAERPREPMAQPAVPRGQTP